jgi:uncharacterized delta-60 repeat protein
MKKATQNEKPAGEVNEPGTSPKPCGRQQSCQTRRSHRNNSWWVFFILGASILTLMCLRPVWAADGDLDSTFNMGSGPFAGVQVIPEIRGTAGYPNVVGSPYTGRTLIHGRFWGLNDGTTTQNNNSIARLFSGGALDPTFVNNQNFNGEIRGVYIYPHDYPVVALQDKILIWGRFFASSGSSQYNNLARLMPDGSIDTSFPIINSYNGAVNTVAVYRPPGAPSDGTGDEILVGGYNLRAGSVDEGSTYQLLRLNYDGSVDTGFTHWGAPNGYITSIRVYSGDPVFGNNVRIFCSYPKNQDGSGGLYYMLIVGPEVSRPDISAPVFSLGDETVDGPIYGIAQQPSDGKWLIVGAFSHVNGLSRKRVARGTYNDASHTWTVDGYDVGTGPNGVVTGIAPMSPSDDRMMAIGSFTTWNGAPCNFIVRLDTAGIRDTSFNSGGTGADDRIRAMNWKNDGTGGWIYGYFHTYNSGGANNSRGGIAGLDANGYVTNSFSNITAMAGWPGMVYSLARQGDGKIIIGGDFNGVCGKYREGLARINSNGSLDTYFKGVVDGIVRSVALQADGKILVGGAFGQCQGFACTSLARVNPDSSLDSTFKPMLVGDDNTVNDLFHVVPLSTGQIMIAGDIYKNVDTGATPVARLNSDGSLDAGFFANVTSIPSPIPDADWLWGTRVAVAGNKYVVAGGYYVMNSAGWEGNHGFLGRLNNDGTLDTTFGPTTPATHIQTMDSQVDDLLLQPDGRIVVSGWFTHVLDGSGSGPARTAIARFSADGFLDATFTPNLTMPPGANSMTVAAMARQPNGKILIEEQFLSYLGNYNFNFISGQAARLLTDGSLDPSFSLGTLTQGYYHPQGGSSILRLPNGKALIGGAYSNYNPTNVFSLARVFASPANLNVGTMMLLLNE